MCVRASPGTSAFSERSCAGNSSRTSGRTRAWIAENETSSSSSSITLPTRSPMSLRTPAAAGRGQPSSPRSLSARCAARTVIADAPLSEERRGRHDRSKPSEGRGRSNSPSRRRSGCGSVAFAFRRDPSSTFPSVPSNDKRVNGSAWRVSDATRATGTSGIGRATSLASGRTTPSLDGERPRSSANIFGDTLVSTVLKTICAYLSSTTCGTRPPRSVVS